MKRRDFLGSCALLSGIATVVRADVASSQAPVRHYARAVLVDVHGAPVRLTTLAPETNYIFQYPYESTP